MTAALHCDGCGNVASTRNGEGETGSADGWYALEQNPIIIGPGLGESGTQFRDMLATFHVDDEDDGVNLMQMEIPPCLHFCRLVCLHEWTTRKVAET